VPTGRLGSGGPRVGGPEAGASRGRVEPAAPAGLAGATGGGWAGALDGAGALLPHISGGKASRTSRKRPGSAKLTPSWETCTAPLITLLSTNRATVANEIGPQMVPLPLRTQY
jgi:hypothetical protein